MADDDEFGDEIDWSTVALPSISASMSVPRAPVNANIATANNNNNNNNNNGSHDHPTMATAGGGGAWHHHSSSLSSSSVPGSHAAAVDGATYQSSSVYPSHNDCGMMTGQNHPTRVTSIGHGSGNTMGTANNNPNAEALRRQIQDLQNQLSTKDEQIFELEATAATSAAESNHRAKQAETRAEKRIHLAEEELRRTRMEAEKYKGSWMRQRKRATELERAGTTTTTTRQQQQPKSNANNGISGSRNRVDVVGSSNRVSGAHHAGGGTHFHRGRMDPLRTWGSPIDASRKVTPSISNEENYDNIMNDHQSPVGAMPSGGGGGGGSGGVSDSSPPIGSSKKRKGRQASSIVKNSVDDVARYLPQQIIGARGSRSFMQDSARLQLAKHILNRDEMGCYSLPGSECATSFPSVLGDSAEMDVDNVDAEKQHQSESNNREREMAASQQSPQTESKAMQQDIIIEKETQSFVKSILYQMVEAPENSIGPGTPETGNLSVSGLIHVLLVRFNSQFHHRMSEDDTALDGDGDHVMDQENDPNKDHPPLNKYVADYQRMSLILPKSVLPIDGQNSVSSEFVTYATVSWRASLYLLNVIEDIILLSGNARDDLRWWFYQSRQSPEGGGGSPSNARSPIPANQQAGKATKDGNGDISHPRIEGLPSGHSGKWREEVLRSKNGCAGQTDIWDDMTMAQPCNTFFEVVVGLMKGNMFQYQQNASTKEKSSTLEIERTLLQLVQLKAIDLVLALMYDAPPYDEAENSQGNRTPYLWKFWFDSLLPLQPSFSKSRAPMSGSSDTLPIGDFISPLEQNDNHCKLLLGSGRKHSTRLLREDLNDNTQSKKQSMEKEGRVDNRSSRRKSASSTSKENNKTMDTWICHDKTKQHGGLLVLIKSQTLRLLTHFMLSSSSVYKSMRKVTKGKGKTSFTKRILAATLDEMEEYIVPFLSSCSSSDFHVYDAEKCLQLCHSCLQYLSILSRSDEGIRMLRLLMRLEDEPWSEEDTPSRWSQSSIGCVTSVLDSTLSFAMRMEETEEDVRKSTHLSYALNTIVDQCIIFFKNILQFVLQQSGSSSKAATFLALISEHRTIFQSCCQKILNYQPLNSIADPPRLLHFSEGLKYDVWQLFETVVTDEKEGNLGRS